MDLATAAIATRGHLHGDNVRFARVTTDSRTLAPGDLFVALNLKKTRAQINNTSLFHS